MKTTTLPELRLSFKEKASILKAMAHPARLFIIEELARQDRNVQELTALVDLDVSTVSKHLAIMKSAGLVADTRKGNMVFYRLLCPCILEFIGCVEDVARASAERSRALIQEFPAKQGNGAQ